MHCGCILYVYSKTPENAFRPRRNDTKTKELIEVVASLDHKKKMPYKY